MVAVDRPDCRRCRTKTQRESKKGTSDAREQPDQTHGLRPADSASIAGATTAGRAAGTAGARRRFDDRRRVGGVRRAVESDGGKDRRMPGIDRFDALGDKPYYQPVDLRD